MSNDRNARSSDLSLARAASRALRRDEPIPMPERGYLRFDARRLLGASPLVGNGDAAAVADGPVSRFGASAWEHLLDAALAALGGGQAFLMNDQGLVIAARGGVSVDEAAGLGARTQLALEQADRMASMSSADRTVLLELDGRWLFGVRFGLGDSVTATFCALVDDVPDARARADVARHVATTALHSPEAADARDASQPPDGARASGPSQAREV